MGDNKGWIKIHRSLQDHWIWDDPNMLKIWLDILLLANHKKKTVYIKKMGSNIDIEIGCFWTSIRKLAERWEISKDTVMKRLDLLEREKMIRTQRIVGCGTLVNVLNYRDYQGFSNGDKDSESDSESDTGRTETRHEQELKNDKELKKYLGRGGAPAEGDY